MIIYLVLFEERKERGTNPSRWFPGGSCRVYIERWRMAEVEGYHDGSTDIPVEHAEVCPWDIAECELDEDTRKALSTLTSHRNHR